MIIYVVKLDGCKAIIEKIDCNEECRTKKCTRRDGDECFNDLEEALDWVRHWLINPYSILH